jgi:hypothetical protein
LRNLDEDFSERARNLIEKQNEVCKIKTNNEMLAMQIHKEHDDDESDEEFQYER